MNELALFAGAGGGILGGVLLGWRTVAAVEIEEYPRAVLLQRQSDGILPKFPIWDDVQTFDGKPWRGKVDVITGGFPCQDISAAGKGAGITGERSGLWSEMARIIGEVRPRFAFMENSPMLTSRGLGTVLGDLAEMGYDARWCVLGADDAGAPHRRKRIWILGYSNNLRELQSKGLQPYKRGRFGNTSKKMADSDGPRLQRPDVRETEHGAEEGLSAEFGETVRNSMRSGLQEERPEQQTTGATRADTRITWWDIDPANATESPVGRVAHGVANRVDRLKAIGNGQVPAVAALAWEILTEGII
jgi:DNA (cytosine-5)-methyltransferase 1